MKKTPVVILFFALSVPFLANGISPQNEQKTKPKKSILKHFDHDQDGRLNAYESSLYKTHLKFGYPLVKKKDQISYDYNKNGMLEPFEWEQYQGFKGLVPREKTQGQSR